MSSKRKIFIASNWKILFCLHRWNYRDFVNK